MIDWRAADGGILLPVRAKPHGGKNAILGVRNGAAIVAVTVAPEQGKANAAIAAVLAEAFGLPKSAVVLHRGASYRDKVFLLAGVDAAEMPALIAKALPA